MTRGRLLFLLVSGLLLVSILSGTILGQARSKTSEDSFYKYLSVFSEVLRLVRQAYVDETDIRTLMAGALEGSSDALDPFSFYIPAAEVEAYMTARAIGSGRSGVRVVKLRGAVYVMAVQGGSPAESAGLQRGTILTKLDGVSTRGMPLWEIEKRLAGPRGSRVELEILRGGETSDLTLELGDFEAPKVTLDEVEGARILRIPSFDSQYGDLVAGLLSNTEDRPLLVDLRGVAWGDPEVAYDVAKIFVKGDLGVLKGRNGTLKSFSNNEEVWQGRLVVLIDRGSQGPAEILASVLQQGAAAKVVGQRSFGFAGRLRLIELDAGGSLLVTDGFYTGPDGEPLNQGVEPDLRVSERGLAFNKRDEPIEDLILDRALEFLRSEADNELEEAA